MSERELEGRRETVSVLVSSLLTCGRYLHASALASRYSMSTFFSLFSADTLTSVAL